VYEVDIAATDKGGLVSHQALSVSVSDVSEGRHGQHGLVAGFSGGDVGSFVHDALDGLRQAMAGFGSDGGSAALDGGMAANPAGNAPMLAADASHHPNAG